MIDGDGTVRAARCESVTARRHGVPAPITLEILGRARQAQAIRILFFEGFDTYELSLLFDRSEPEIVALLHAYADADAGKGDAR